MAAILNQLQLQTNGKSCQANKVFKTAYGHNTALMSVDHKYDSLWEDQDGKSQVILLPDDDSDGELLPGTFSMLVTAAKEISSKNAKIYVLIIS
jgi:hypothetical protein